MVDQIQNGQVPVSIIKIKRRPLFYIDTTLHKLNKILLFVASKDTLSTVGTSK